MTNAEKYTKEIIAIAKVNGTVAVNKDTQQICDCCHINFECCNCLFQTTTGSSCDGKRAKWFDTEYDLLAKCRNLPIDSKVWVRANDRDDWHPRHFAGIDESDLKKPFLAYMNGFTSWTSQYIDPPTTNWEEMKLADTE